MAIKAVHLRTPKAYADHLKLLLENGRPDIDKIPVLNGKSTGPGGLPAKFQKFVDLVKRSDDLRIERAKVDQQIEALLPEVNEDLIAVQGWLMSAWSSTSPRLPSVGFSQARNVKGQRRKYEPKPGQVLASEAANLAREENKVIEKSIRNTRTGTMTYSSITGKVTMSDTPTPAKPPKK